MPITPRPSDNLYSQMVRRVAEIEDGSGTAPSPAQLPSGYKMEWEPLAGKSWMQLSQKGLAEDSQTGWKFHISVHPQDLPKAWGLIADYMPEAGIQKAKVAGPKNVAKFSDPAHEQSGKMIVLYDTGTPGWDNRMRDIENILKDNDIRPGSPVKGDRRIAGSRYGFYRNDGNDGTGGYISAENAARSGLPESVRYNPKGLYDPFMNIDVSNVYAARNLPLVAPSPPTPIHSGVDLVSQQKWEGMTSPREGSVLRADASNMDVGQRQVLMSQLKSRGVDAKVVRSNTFGKDYIQVSPEDAAKLIDTNVANKANNRTSPSPSTARRAWLEQPMTMDGIFDNAPGNYSPPSSALQGPSASAVTQSKVTSIDAGKVEISPTQGSLALDPTASHTADAPKSGPVLVKSNQVPPTPEAYTEVPVVELPGPQAVGEAPHASVVPNESSPHVSNLNTAVAGANVLMGGYGAYQNAREGKWVGATISGAGAVDGLTVIASEAAPKAFEDGMGKNISDVTGEMGGPLLLLQNTYDVSTAKPGERGMTAAKALVSDSAMLGVGGVFSGVETTSILGGVAVGVGGFVLPAAAGMAAGYYFEKDCRLTDIVNNANARIDSIHVDPSGHSHLRAFADDLDKRLADYKAEMKKEGKPVPEGDFARTKDGKIDLNNQDNLKVLNAYMDEQRREIDEVMGQNEGMAALPEAFKNGTKEQIYYTLKETRKSLDVAQAESRDLRISQYNQPVDKPQDKLQADYQKLQAQGKVTQYNYRIDNGRILGEDNNPVIPDNVKEHYRQDPQHNVVTPEVFYNAKGQADHSIVWTIRDTGIRQGVPPEPTVLAAAQQGPKVSMETQSVEVRANTSSNIQTAQPVIAAQFDPAPTANLSLPSVPVGRPNRAALADLKRQNGDAFIAASTADSQHEPAQPVIVDVPRAPVLPAAVVATTQQQAPTVTKLGSKPSM